MLEIQKLFSVAPKFKEWIENTSLFNAIKLSKGLYEVRAHTEDEDISLLLNGVVIDKAEDLPIELIQKFYENSPWYNPDKNLNFKLLENADSSDTAPIS